MFRNLNLGLIIHTLASLTGGVGLAMFVCFLVALGYGEGDAEAHLIAALITIMLSITAYKLTSKYPGEITHREGILIVALCWFLLGPVGAMPFYFYGHHTFNFIPERAEISAYAQATGPQAVHGFCKGISAGGPGSEFCSATNCLFESISGFTTTGSSILNEPSLWQQTTRTTSLELPHGIQFWRHVTHFLGGLGIIILSIAILPLLGIGGMQLFKVEVAGPTADKLSPRIAETARMLWLLYVVLTAAVILLIWLGGTPFFTAICFAFSAMATGGFAPLSASAAGLHSLFAELVIGAAMLISSTSFTLHYKFLNKKFLCYLKDTQTKAYIGIITVVSVTIAIIIYCNNDSGFFQALHTALFQVISLISSTALSTADYSSWGQISPLCIILLLSLILIGGCAGSTAGGPKVIRAVIAWRVAFRELLRLIHPKAVYPLKVGGKPVEQSILDGVFGFFILYFLCTIFGTFILCACGYDIPTSLSGILAHIGNIGSSFAQAGSYGSYNFMNSTGKWVLIFMMLMGRLELYNMLVLATRGFWKR